jgi:hypothetical protein
MDVNRLLLSPRKLLSTPTTKPLSFGKFLTLVTKELVSYHVPMFPGISSTRGRQHLSCLASSLAVIQATRNHLANGDLDAAMHMAVFHMCNSLA